MKKIVFGLIVGLCCLAASAHAQQSKPTPSIVDYWANFESRATPVEQAKASTVVISVKLATAMTLASLERKKEMSCVFELSENDIKHRTILSIQAAGNARINGAEISQWKVFQWMAWALIAQECGLPRPNDKIFE